MGKKILFTIVLAVLAVLFWKFFVSSATPDGQGPLAMLGTSDADRVKSLFNAHKDKTRVVVLLSPT